MGRPSKESQLEMPGAREALRDAAGALFAQHGYAATGVQEIANAAGVNKAMLYYYFGSKEQLYAALVQDGIAMVEEAVRAAEATDLPLADRLRQFLQTYLTVVVDHPAIARILFREVMGSGEEARQMVTDHFTEIIRRLAAVLDTAQAQGEFGDCDTTLAAYSLFGMANMFITSHFLTGRPLEAPRLVEHMVGVFSTGCVRV